MYEHAVLCGTITLPYSYCPVRFIQAHEKSGFNVQKLDYHYSTKVDHSAPILCLEQLSLLLARIMNDSSRTTRSKEIREILVACEKLAPGVKIHWVYDQPPSWLFLLPLPYTT